MPAFPINATGPAPLPMTPHEMTAALAAGVTELQSSGDPTAARAALVAALVAAGKPAPSTQRANELLVVAMLELFGLPGRPR